MERIQHLPKNELIKELKSFKKYETKTNAQIKTKLGDDKVKTLRDELMRLEVQRQNKKTQLSENEPMKTKLIYLEGNGYTKEELIKMVRYYHNHVIESSNEHTTFKESTKSPSIPELNNDVIKEIMLNATSNTIKNMCLTNKSAIQLCNNRQFWHDKFNHDSLPQLIVVKKHYDKKLVIQSEMKKIPQNAKQWILSYDKMLKSYHLADKLVTNIINTKRFTNFMTTENAKNMLWLPKSMLNVLKNEPRKIYLYFAFKKKKYYLSLSARHIQEQYDSESENDDVGDKIYVSKKEFIHYLTLLMYYINHNIDFIDTETAFFNLKDLKNSTKKIKIYFPDW